MQKAGVKLSFKRKQVYVWLALVFGLLLLFTVFYDFSMTVWFQSLDPLPAGWRPALMLLHSATFFIFVIGFIYSREAHSTRDVIVALAAFAINLMAFIMRIVYELWFIDFHPAVYNS